MDRENCSSITEILFLGITTTSEIKVTVFIIILAAYLINILANLGMIISIRLDSQLHTTMYFFLSYPSFCDLCYSTAIGPKTVVDFFAKNKSISFVSCALQFFIFCIFGDTGCLLMTVMAFDKYKALNNPLLRVCTMVMAGVYLVGMMDVLTHTTLAFCLFFHESNEINHFFCDMLPLCLLSCSDMQVNELVLFTIFVFIELSTISGVIVSYCYIILSVLKIHSCEGKSKAFSTCISHLTALAIFQGTIIFMYFWSSSYYSLDQDEINSMFYTLLISMLNPLIYSLWNNDVKEALERLKNKRWF